MSKEYQTIKVWKDTLKALRLLAAYRGRPMVEVLDGLVAAALKSEQAKQKATK